MKLFYYDLETFLDTFLFIGKFAGEPKLFIFEISWRRNYRDALLAHLSYLQNLGAEMVGFNNLGFDNNIVETLLHNPYTFVAQTAYLKAQEIIKGQNGDRFFSTVSVNDRILPQIDLYKINHFDNKAKTTSLKALQFAMRSESVEDLPFDPHQPLTSEQIDQLISYGCHDVTETEKFGEICEPLIKMRRDLISSGTLRGDVMNFSDVKIGTEYLISKIGRAKCFISGAKPRQTPREKIEFKTIILPKIAYRTEPFEKVKEWFEQQTIWTQSEERPRLETSLAGLQFHFGVGGVHASVENRIFESNQTHVIKDVDVSGMYVAVAIANGFHPEHLGQDFVTAYRQLQHDRAQYKKGTTMNAVLKLAGNGAYGNSNNDYSCLFDPKYTFSVTVNGQLQLIQLAEVFSMIPGLEMIQANTDGITVRIPREMEVIFNLWCRDWEKQTGLKLEEVEYKKVWIRDVNNYIALKPDGELKRKGAYWYPETLKDYEGWWNKDFSNMTAQKGVEQVLIKGASPEDIVRCLSDKFDFMLRYKTTKGAKVFIGDQEMPKTVRYYVSTAGQPMKKVAEPKGVIGTWKRRNGLTDQEYNDVFRTLPNGAWDERIHTKNKSKYEIVTTNIENGRLVKECNRASKFNWSDVDFDYYAQEIRKLIIGETHA